MVCDCLALCLLLALLEQLLFGEDFDVTRLTVSVHQLLRSWGLSWAR